MISLEMNDSYSCLSTAYCKASSHQVWALGSFIAYKSKTLALGECSQKHGQFDITKPWVKLTQITLRQPFHTALINSVLLSKSVYVGGLGIRVPGSVTGLEKLWFTKLPVCIT